MYTLFSFFNLLSSSPSHAPSLLLPLPPVASCLPLTMSFLILEMPLLKQGWSVRGPLLIRGKTQNSRTPSLSTVITFLIANEHRYLPLISVLWAAEG